MTGIDYLTGHQGIGNSEDIALLFSIILALGFLCQWLAWRVKLPAIIFLLTAGVFLGPVMHWFNPDRLFGELLFSFVSLAVAVILFEGSLSLKFQNISGLKRVIRNLITFGVLITWLLTATATRWIFGFSWEVCFLFAALMVVTGPTVIIPILRTVRPKEKVAHVLMWEGILIDPIGAILAVLVFEFIISGGATGSLTNETLVFGKIVLLGSGLGVAGGYCFAALLRKYWIPYFLQNFAALVLVCLIFSLSNQIATESGLLSVTVMGVYLANRRGIELEDILNFKETLSVLLISILFIVLAARIDATRLAAFGWGAFTLFLVLQCIIRPVSVHLCALRSKLTLPERHLLAWIAPRGIVAAAISAVFAIKLEALGYAGAFEMVPLTFLMIAATVLLQSATAGRMARFLKVAEPPPTGFLIVGANQVAQTIALQLMNNKIQVILADENWEAISEAKMKGLRTYWGNPVSEHAEKHLNLLGIGYLLAITPSNDLNALVLNYYRSDFGPGQLFFVQNDPGVQNHVKNREPVKSGGRRLFEDHMTYQWLCQKLREGAEVKTTTLTDEFTYEAYLKASEPKRLPLFAIDLQERVYVFVEETTFSPAAGWRIIGLTTGIKSA